ncbi:MAG: protocatechuate 3,4-dioxygenase subunit alpha [Rhizobiales bacterium]|nr:protocatechuate 3,4-dioxygenase subunit alpha [Hyphomicrobiales bacterium]
MSDITPSQTVGPFFAYGLAPHSRCDWQPSKDYDSKETVSANLITPDATGTKIHIEGSILDGDGKPINDAMIEIWQADAQGRYAHARGEKPRPNAKFTGFGRSATDKQGVYSFDTVKPGMVPGPAGKPQAPHIVVCIFSRGMLRQIYTRIYFADEAANSADPILAMVPADRRATLIAHKEMRGELPVYRFDIRVQGENETVFFDI